ncbi:MAG: hypothetical protein NT023_23835 [Armatimonadetes bacterium]|nr:hypothetical protein [Armatimonadota bacterium]
MGSQSSKNDVAWESLFAERDILGDVDRNGMHLITAEAINKRREARLMTKFDHIVNLPEIFARNGLSILPNSRTSYVIGRFDCYQRLSAQQEPEITEWAFPDWIQSLSPDDLYSESSALLCAQHSGLLADVLDDENIALTVFGRMSTGTFDFSIQENGRDQGAEITPRILTVDRAQCEIDGAFESANSFAILEVKNEEVNDFHIRQLYYPYRLWRNKMSKPVVPVFLTYSNEVFSFSVYDFVRPDDYNSLELVKRKRYQIAPTEIEISDIRRLLTQTKIVPEATDIPFPQADRFERVIDLLGRLYAANGSLEQEEITTNYDFDRRQTQYYTNAGRYLGLIERKEEGGAGVSYTLTSPGRQIMNKTPKARNLALTEIILSHSVFRKAVEYYLTHAAAPPIDAILDAMRDAALPINDTTGARRAQSVLGWVRWLMYLTASG